MVVAEAAAGAGSLVAYTAFGGGVRLHCFQPGPRLSRPSTPFWMEGRCYNPPTTGTTAWGFLHMTRFGLAGVLTLGLLACTEQQAPAEAPPPPGVGVVEVTAQEISPTREFVGRTQAIEDAKLRARVEGPLISRSFTEGEDVQQGQVLFEIDPEPYQAEVRRVQALLTSAESALTVAERNFERGEQLVGDGYISQTQMDELRAKRDGAAAAIDEAKSALASAQLNLDYTKIVAPFTGRAGNSNFSIGDLVGPQAGELVSIVQLDPMWVNFQVAESAMVEAMQTNIQRQQEGLEELKFTPRLRLSTGTEYPLPGVIDFVDNRIDQTTGTIKVRATFPNPSGLLLPGQFVTLVIQRSDKRSVLLVPQSAILEDQQGAYVLVVNDQNIVIRQNIKAGERIGVDRVVDEGLQPGTKVITTGLQKVRPGVEVTAKLETPALSSSQ